MTEEKERTEIDLLEEDDEFEEFPVDGNMIAVKLQSTNIFAPADVHYLEA